MKTIKLTNNAYSRLSERKKSPRESFSHVVLEVVPKRGTLGQMLEDVQGLKALEPDHMRVMEEATEWGADPKGLGDRFDFLAGVRALGYSDDP